MLGSVAKARRPILRADSSRQKERVKDLTALVTRHPSDASTQIRTYQPANPCETGAACGTFSSVLLPSLRRGLTRAIRTKVAVATVGPSTARGPSPCLGCSSSDSNTSSSAHGGRRRPRARQRSHRTGHVLLSAGDSVTLIPGVAFPGYPNVRSMMA